MRKISILSGILILFSLVLAACGSATPASPTAMPVNITITTDPSPAMVGDTEIVLTITDQNGQPLEGAQVDVSAEHTEMMGMAMNGLATEQDGGIYAIKGSFDHPGKWKVTVYVRKDELDVKQEIPLEVQ